jgi:hypothetical protein
MSRVYLNVLYAHKIVLERTDMFFCPVEVLFYTGLKK